MKTATRFITTLVVAVSSLLAAPAFADPCGAVLCLSTNKMAPWQCKGHVDEYFNIKVSMKPCKKCGEVFDPGATAAKRYSEVLQKCPDARPVDRDSVSALYGTLQYSPFDYIGTDDKGNSTGYVASSLTTITERRYLTCSEASSTYNLATPTADALSIPDGTTAWVDGTQVVAGSGFQNWPLFDENGQLVQFGFGIETREVTKTTGQGTVTNVTDWKATTTHSCTISQPSLFASSSSD